MNRKRITILTVLITIFTLAACSSESNITRPASDRFVPGEVLMKLPIYPDAVGATDIKPPGWGPPSSPIFQQACTGYPCPGFQMATATYKVNASSGIKVLNWYDKELGNRGYIRRFDESRNLPSNAKVRAVTWFLPASPLITVEVHVYSYGSLETDQDALFDMLVSYLSPSPKPSREMIPADIARVDITYNSNVTDRDIPLSTTSKTITDKATIKRLIDAINQMPLDSNWMRFQCVGHNNNATLQFKPKNNGADITVKIVNGCIFFVSFEGFPNLEDVNRVLWNMILDIFGEQTPPPSTPTFGPPPATPTPPNR